MSNIRKTIRKILREDEWGWAMDKNIDVTYETSEYVSIGDTIRADKNGYRLELPYCGNGSNDSVEGEVVRKIQNENNTVFLIKTTDENCGWDCTATMQTQHLNLNDGSTCWSLVLYKGFNDVITLVG